MFPCKLAYITPCNCWKLQPYVRSNSDDPNDENVKGSLDSVLGEYGTPLADDLLEIGEVNVHGDGMIRLDDGCELFYR